MRAYGCIVIVCCVGVTAGCQRLADELPGILLGIVGATDPNDPNAFDPNSLPDANRPAQGADPNDAGVTGSVDAVLCADLIAVRDAPMPGTVGVFRPASSRDDFSRWRAGDAVAFDAMVGELSNLDRDRELGIWLLGTVSAESRVRRRNSVFLTLALEDGSFWFVESSDAGTFATWHDRDDVVVITPPGGDDRIILNINACSAVRVDADS